MFKITQTLCWSAFVLVVAVSCTTSVQASLLIYEGFNGYTTGALAGQSANGNTIGLTGSYVDAVYSGCDFTTTGLTFGSGATTYVVNGGALANSSNTYGAVGVRLNAGTISGTLYGSYLFNLGGSVTAGARVESRFNTVSTSATTTAYFDAQGANGASKSGLKYDAAGSTSTSADVSGLLLANTTYMLLSKWDGIGATASSGSGTLWVITSAQYDAMLSGGNLTEAYLNTVGNTLWTLTTTGSGSSVLNNGDFLQLLAGSGTAGFTRTIDEIKYGSSLMDVAAVPEPTSMALLCGAVVVLAISVRQRRLSA